MTKIPNLAGAIVITIVLPACSFFETDEFANQPVHAAGTAPMPAPDVPSRGETPSAVEDDSIVLALEVLMKPYGVCHQLLSEDESAGVNDCARALMMAASETSSSLPDSVQDHLEAVRSNATILSETPAKLNALRLAFGEVSRSMVSLIGGLPVAGLSYHVFKCPMTMSYNRWVQVDVPLVNPYMGSAMEDCGYEVE